MTVAAINPPRLLRAPSHVGTIPTEQITRVRMCLQIEAENADGAAFTEGARACVTWLQKRKITTVPAEADR